ncbi:hypothetical protein AGDE_13135 [Angomonas deanei]|uniref:Alpha/beta hydrolase family n=1 Tax=Angomonas deanei TaxID=59799 RepID=A0A7G2C6P6_9TRYP|nr:hypothetical protein AGDE_13135 [Angomonas deanei]CAD2215498.1 hypothetical protein, conserved [Angomonas deanei]|eukprot:EPY22655.1 hypothetical protein AGDE_13135 [Angomonas deanei]
MTALDANPFLFPSFTEVDLSSYCCSREPYYKLWRVVDLVADSHGRLRVDGEQFRVPVVYLHGNGGSFSCARSLARFLSEANVRQQAKSLLRFDERVATFVYSAARESGEEVRRSVLVDGEIPPELWKRGEEHVLHMETPLLQTELFPLDFLEESNTHSVAIMVKEARFVNHSLHYLMSRLRDTYSPVLGGGDSARLDHVKEYVEYEYAGAMCHNELLETTEQCRIAREHLAKYDTVDRVRREATRVSEGGFWIWGESYGGVIGLIASLIDPDLIAGIVLLSTPVHFPPLLMEYANEYLQRALYTATVGQYPYPFQGRPSTDWDELVRIRDPVRFGMKLGTVPAKELGARLENITLISMNGGTFDYVVPAVDTYLLQYTPRQYFDDRRLWLNRCPSIAYHRDISTEALRDVGVPSDHRRMVYGAVFFGGERHVCGGLRAGAQRRPPLRHGDVVGAAVPRAAVPTRR